MASQGEDFVTLLAVSADGSHNPQPFRLRVDQPLRRFLRAYANFRELGPTQEVDLKVMSEKCGQLDLACSANAYSFKDGDTVIVTTSGAQASADGDAAAALWQQPKEEPEEAAGGYANADAMGRHGNRGRGRGAVVSIKRPSRHVRESTEKRVSPKAKAEAKHKAKGKAKAKAKAKGKAKGKAKAVRMESRSQMSLVGTPERARISKSAVVLALSPSVPRSRVQRTKITSGPAKGWHVAVWLRDTAGKSSLRWRIVSPDRDVAFSRFRSTSGKANLQDTVGEGVFTQIYTAIRPQLVRRINAKRADIENAAPPKKRRLSGLDDVTPAPLPAPRSSVAPTQPFDAETEGEQAGDTQWACSCLAHLRRHPHCLTGARRQPAVIHLLNNVLVGRAEGCDVILDSQRTPQMISRTHAAVTRQGDRYILTDQGSLNGLHVNGEKVNGTQALTSGDVVTFGVPSAQPEFDYLFESRPSEAE